jgi:UDP-N-acetyl-D-galactosamine dehydrogenase
VGGHCIGVDPYYLTHRAEIAGYHPEVVLAGRRVNDGVGARVARECIRLMLARGCSKPVVTVLGLTFKEDVPDTRNSKVVDIIRELESFGIAVQVHDPMADAKDAAHEYGITLMPESALQPADAVILAVAHKRYLEAGWGFVTRLLRDSDGAVLDVKGCLDRARVPAGLTLWRM